MIHDKQQTIIYRQRRLPFCIKAITSFVVFPLVSFFIGSRLILDNRAHWVLPVVILCGVMGLIGGGHMLRKRALYKVALYNDKIEWLNGFAFKSVPITQIFDVQCDVDEIFLSLSDASGNQSRAIIPKWLFGSASNAADFLSELRSRLGAAGK